MPQTEAMENGKLTEILEFVKSAAEQAKGFELEHAPMVAQEIVAYGRSWNTSSLAACSFLLVSIGSLWLLVCRASEWHWNVVFTMSVLSFMASVAIGVLAVFYAREAALAWRAPRVYIIEYITRLLKESNC